MKHLNPLNWIPEPDLFYKDYLEITEGHYFGSNKQERSYQFRLLISKLEPEDEFKIIKYLINSLNNLNNRDQERSVSPRKSTYSYFKNYGHFISFFAGIVHYCPIILINQLSDSLTKRRHYAMEIMRLSISTIVCRLQYRLDTVFLIRTSHSSPNPLLVFEEFLKRFCDRELSIRIQFLNTAAVLMTCDSRLDWKIQQDVSSRVARIIQCDPKSEIRARALVHLEDMSKPSNKPTCVINEDIMNAMIRVCFDENDNLRLFAHEKIASIYIHLMCAFSSNDAFYIGKIGKLAGALRIRFDKTKEKSEERYKLYLHLETIQKFLYKLPYLSKESSRDSLEM